MFQPHDSVFIVVKSVAIFWENLTSRRLGPNLFCKNTTLDSVTLRSSPKSGSTTYASILLSSIVSSGKVTLGRELRRTFIRSGFRHMHVPEASCMSLIHHYVLKRLAGGLQPGALAIDICLDSSNDSTGAQIRPLSVEPSYCL